MAGTSKLTAQRKRKPKSGNLIAREAVSQPLPQELRPLFWDMEFRRLRWQRDRDFIIGRVLAEGDSRHTRWLMETAGKDAIREWIARRRGRGLGARTLRFWEVVLDLPRREVTRWIAEQMAYPWASRAAR